MIYVSYGIKLNIKYLRKLLFLGQQVKNHLLIKRCNYLSSLLERYPHSTSEISPPCYPP